MPAKHTPGPWVTRADKFFPGDTTPRFIYTAGGVLIAVCALNHPPDELRANANVLASSPDLLDVLRDALPTLERAATEEARANRAPTGCAPRKAAMYLHARAVSVLATAEGR